MKVYSLKNGELCFVGGDPRGAMKFIRNSILSEGVKGIEPEDLARELETLARMVRDTARDFARGPRPAPGPNESPGQEGNVKP